MAAPFGESRLHPYAECPVVAGLAVLVLPTVRHQGGDGIAHCKIGFFSRGHPYTSTGIITMRNRYMRNSYM